MDENKVVTLDALSAAVNKIRTDYPTRADVSEQISQASLGAGAVYATEADVLALFEDHPTE